MERAATSGYRASLEDGQAEVVAEVCRRLDGVALAIELVASRTGAFGLQGVADMLGEGFQLHGYGRRGAPAPSDARGAVRLELGPPVAARSRRSCNGWRRSPASSP